MAATRIEERLRDLGLTPQQAVERREVAERIQGRLERVQLTAEEASVKARLGSPKALQRIIDGIDPLPRGPKFPRLAEVLECSISLLIGLDPDVEVPAELLVDDQPSFSLLSPDAGCVAARLWPPRHRHPAGAADGGAEDGGAETRAGGEAEGREAGLMADAGQRRWPRRTGTRNRAEPPFGTTAPPGVPTAEAIIQPRTTGNRERPDNAHAGSRRAPPSRP